MSELQKCPVCDGRGFVKGNFYDVAGQTCSFGDYAKKQQSSTICMYCNGNGVVNVGYIKEKEVDIKLKEYQVELKVKGEGGIYPYIVSAMKEEWAEQDAIQMLLRDFPIFNGKDIFTYKTICVNKGDIIEDTLDLIKQIYKKYSTGGALHIVLDDYNTDDENILWCLQNSIPDEEFCEKQDRKMFERCAINLIKINENRRKNVIQKSLENL